MRSSTLKVSFKAGASPCVRYLLPLSAASPWRCDAYRRPGESLVREERARELSLAHASVQIYTPGLVWSSKGPLRVALRSPDRHTHVVVPLWPDCVSPLAGQASYECQPLMML
jgi:hypothetical protein